MTPIRFATASLLLAVAVPILAADAPTKESLAAAQGLDHWSEVAEIRFTFVVQRPDQTIARRWNWSVSDDKVTLQETKTPAKGEATTTTTSYRRDQLEGDDAIAADKKFINDSFWLLWPLHLQWSDDAKLGPATDGTDPIGGGKCRVVTLSYPPDAGGYTPGDSYDLFLPAGSDRPVAWAYHKAGAKEATLTTSRERYQQVGPLTLSTLHKTKDADFELRFEDVAIRKEGSKEWVSATSLD